MVSLTLIYYGIWITFYLIYLVSALIDWDDVWIDYQALSDTSENISTDFTHSFFIVQPRIGVRVYLTHWMALSGSIEVPLSKLSSGGWKLNDADVYNAPELDLIAPFFHFSILFGG